MRMEVMEEEMGVKRGEEARERAAQEVLREMVCVSLCGLTQSLSLSFCVLLSLSLSLSLSRCMSLSLSLCLS